MKALSLLTSPVQTIKAWANRSGRERSDKEFFEGMAQHMGMKVMQVEKLFAGLMTQDGLSFSALGNYEGYLKVGTKKVWATWKSCDIIANVCMDTAHDFYRQGDKASEPIKIPELQKLFMNPNPSWTMADMIYLWVFHMKLTGNAFWYKADATLNGDRPRELYPLNPKRMRLSTDRTGTPIGYIYSTTQGEIPFDLNELIIWRRPHADNDYWGMGDIEAGEDLFKEFINRQTWGQKFWQNGASPSGILICEDQISDEKEFEKAKLKWKKEYSGAGNSGKTAWLTGKWKYQQLGLTAQDMQNIESQRFNVENIFHQHGVPLSIVGMKEAANYATAQIDDMAFRRYTIKPHLTRFAGELNRSLVRGYNPAAELRFNVSGLTNVNQVVTDYAPLFDRGALSLNELRELAGMKRLDDPMFDEHYINAGLSPLALAGVANTANTDAAAKAIIMRFITDGGNASQLPPGLTKLLK